MGRMYTVMMDQQSISASGDLLQIAPGAGKPIKIHRMMLSQHADETSQHLAVDLVKATTDGSGGTSVTAAPNTSGTPAAGTTCLRQNSTPAAGTITKYYKRGDNALNGWDYDPTAEEMFEVASSDVAVVRLLDSPTAALTMTCVIIFEELG